MNRGNFSSILLPLAALTAVIGTLLFLSENNETSPEAPLRRRQLLPFINDPKTTDIKPAVSNVPWNGIQNAPWCLSPEKDEVNTPPVDLSRCGNGELIRMDIIGGLTSYLNKILRVALWAAEDDACFYIDEEEGRMNAKLGYRIPEENFVHGFLDRYFEHMGVWKSQYDEMVEANSVKVINPSVPDIASHEFGKHGLLHAQPSVRYRARSIPKFGYNEMDSISLKKHFLRRIFRIKPIVREFACQKLEAHPGLENEYMALSIRRGDKVTEFELVKTVEPYIEKAETAITTHFGGIPPTFFVATDDCTVMQEFREARPNWNFVSECDKLTEADGFVFKDMTEWTEEQTDHHFTKFIAEMIAMASAKYWIGVSTTNVSYWIYFMRSLRAHDDTFEFVDKESDMKPW